MANDSAILNLKQGDLIERRTDKNSGTAWATERKQRKKKEHRGERPQWQM